MTNSNDYQRDVFVRQLGRSSLGGPTPISATQVPVLKQYRFYSVFPTNVSDIPLSYDSSDSIEEFTVEMQVQWWDALDPEGKTQLGTNS